MKTISTIAFVTLAAFGTAAHPETPPGRITGPNKEPRYRTAPAYGLLFLDDDVGKAVWLVRDHDTLYVDCNGDGDLSEPGEAFRPAGERGGVVTFRVARLAVPGLRREYRNLEVHVDLPSRKRGVEESWVVEMEVEGRGRLVGALLPGARPNKTGKLLFGAPLRLTVAAGMELKRGEPTDLFVAITTPARRIPTAGVIHGKGIPANAHPVAELRFPGKAAGKVVTNRFPLTKRC